MKNLKDEFNDLKLSDLANALVTDYNSGYICDNISEKSDSGIDCYYCDLFEWAKTHYDDINAAIQEFGTPDKDFDIIKILQQGQYYAKERELYDDLDNIILGIIFYNLAEQGFTEVTDEQFDELLTLAGNTDNNDRTDSLIEQALEIVNNTDK